MVRKLTAAATALATLVVSCAPETSQPTKVRALVLSSNGEYTPTEVELKTLTDVASLEGKVARFVGSASIQLSGNDPGVQAATTEDALRRAMTKDSGRSITASFIPDAQGVLTPADFHSWNVTTTYYNLERAWEYFNTVANVPQAQLPQTPVYYFPEFILGELSDKPQRDNALFFAPMGAFMVLPFDTLQKAPLAINASILTHEYAHLVFNRRVFDGRALPPPLTVWSQEGFTPGLNVIKAMDEGIADYHAYVASCATRFGCNTRVLSTTYDDALVASRDLATPRCMDALTYNQLLNANLAEAPGLEYRVGTLIAHALYRSAGTDAERQALVRALVDTYSDPDGNKYGFNQLASGFLNSQESFTLAVAAKAIVQHLPAGSTLQAQVCNNFVNILQIPASSLAGANACPASTVPGDCPTIYSTP
ncbi:hypothetical protein [Cystobacter fuscus]|uniref:hypothetical protein n=1 Tax=Cystobacter fuscus TaxID=43 RepID=UPI002B300FA0|nr:hypothetical protein F0U63_30245 [Cystobacter fuscus]